ncbi:hypothetical protein CAC42_7845 [Sphaceloma murrayae]|uniref:N-acetyltransferase domain-containing protein n=1 Tax=Sphaceloma murrayae TaxID=2082308 RepID=A0A2K1QXU4_9PEZI|nr:hypothetical protein CAC42_7845 [Sphaceloma murrayae]
MALMVVRPRVEGDFSGLAAVLKQVHLTSGYPVEGIDNPVQFLSPDTEVKAWVLTDAENNVIGHAMVSEVGHNDRRANAWTDYQKRTGDSPACRGLLALGRVFVDPSTRCNGAGTMLVKTATDWAAERLSRRLILNVLHKDDSAISLYVKLGWRKIGDGVHVTSDRKRYNQIYMISPPLSDLPLVANGS